MKERNYGIDFLRILSMFMVVILHVLGQGGVLSATVPGSLKYWMAWLLEITCYCAVNCFALISGYVMWHSNAKISKALNLWLQTFFYTGLALVIFFIFKRDSISFGSILNALFPITRQHYWYITAYFGLLVLSPLLNVAIIHTNKKIIGSVLLTVLVLFSVLPHLLLSEPYNLSGGYSLMWLVLLYLIGGYFSKYNVADKIKKSLAWLILILMVFLSFLSKFILESFPQNIYPTSHMGNMFIKYISPNFILIALALLTICSKASFGPRSTKLIGIFAPAALGVYLIHTNSLVWNNWFSGFSSHFADQNCIVMILLTISSAIAIYAICTVIELFRIRLFKILKINKLCSFIEQKTINYINKKIERV